MNQEIELKLQAFLDDELEAGQAREVADLIARDPKAAALCAELTEISQLVKGNELRVNCPDTREFYWSQIERGIGRDTVRENASGRVGSSWWARYLVPAFGAALLFAGGLSLLKLSAPSGRLSYLQEIDTPSDETSAISFHSQSAGMTVVWVQNKAF
jgi:anti-sigma factor RsiW